MTIRPLNRIQQAEADAIKQAGKAKGVPHPDAAGVKLPSRNIPSMTESGATAKFPLCVQFVSTHENWEKERSGAKCNTLRRIDATDKRFIGLRNGTRRISIINKATGSAFEREITDYTEWEGLAIISWKDEAALAKLESENGAVVWVLGLMITMSHSTGIYCDGHMICKNE